MGILVGLKNISLDPDLNNSREFLLIKNENYSDTLVRTYKIVNINTIEYQLFKRNSHTIKQIL